MGSLAKTVDTIGIAPHLICRLATRAGANSTTSAATVAQCALGCVCARTDLLRQQTVQRLIMYSSFGVVFASKVYITSAAKQLIFEIDHLI